jgi:hypothetical protein
VTGSRGDLVQPEAGDPLGAGLDDVLESADHCIREGAGHRDRDRDHRGEQAVEEDVVLVPAVTPVENVGGGGGFHCFLPPIAY